MDREGLVHRGIEIRFAGRSYRVPLSDLAGGRAITIYGQQEVVKDLIAARLGAGGDIRFDVDGVGSTGSTRPSSISYRADGRGQVIECDFVAGCDGSTAWRAGPSRRAS